MKMHKMVSVSIAFTLLEKVQLEAARLLTGLPLFTSKQYLYIETGWEKLSDRRERRKLTLFHKIFHNNTPEYLTEILMPHFRNNRYNLRSDNYMRISYLQTIEIYLITANGA